MFIKTKFSEYSSLLIIIAQTSDEIQQTHGSAMVDYIVETKYFVYRCVTYLHISSRQWTDIEITHKWGTLLANGTFKVD